MIFLTQPWMSACFYGAGLLAIAVPVFKAIMCLIRTDAAEMRHRRPRSLSAPMAGL